MGNGTEFKRVAIAKGTGGVPPHKLRLTYLVLTFDGNQLAALALLSRYRTVLDVKHVRGAQNPDVTVTLGGPFKRNDASPDGKGSSLSAWAAPCLNGGPSPQRPLSL